MKRPVPSPATQRLPAAVKHPTAPRPNRNGERIAALSLIGILGAVSGAGALYYAGAHHAAVEAPPTTYSNPDIQTYKERQDILLGMSGAFATAELIVIGGALVARRRPSSAESVPVLSSADTAGIAPIQDPMLSPVAAPAAETRPSSAAPAPPSRLIR